MFAGIIDILVRWDKTAFDLIHKSLNNSVAFFFLNSITDFADLTLLILAFYCLFILIKKKKLFSNKWFQVVGVVIVAALLNMILKMIFMRPAPEAIHIARADFSPTLVPYAFPSGHSTRAFALAATLSIQFPRWRILLICAATIIGFSRIYIGAHFPADVIAGAILGISISVLFTKLAVKR